MAANAPPLLKVHELLSPSAIQLGLRGIRRDEVLQELVELVPALRDHSPEQDRLLRALLEREEMHSTGIGDGLALPHTRNTLGGVVEHPLIAVGRHPAGVAFGAIDGHPVRLFFLLLTTSVTQHLHILARMSRLLRQPNLRRDLLTAKEPTELIHLIRTAEG